MASGLEMHRINRPDVWLHRPSRKLAGKPCQNRSRPRMALRDMLMLQRNGSFRQQRTLLFSRGAVGRCLLVGYRALQSAPTNSNI